VTHEGRVFFINIRLGGVWGEGLSGKQVRVGEKGEFILCCLFFFVRREFKRRDFSWKIIHVDKVSLSGELGESPTSPYIKMNYCAPHLSLSPYQCNDLVRLRSKY
jgi:hypothetical protein